MWCLQSYSGVSFVLLCCNDLHCTKQTHRCLSVDGLLTCNKLSLCWNIYKLYSNDLKPNIILKAGHLLYQPLKQHDMLWKMKCQVYCEARVTCSKWAEKNAKHQSLLKFDPGAVMSVQTRVWLSGEITPHCCTFYVPVLDARCQLHVHTNSVNPWLVIGFITSCLWTVKNRKCFSSFFHVFTHSSSNTFLLLVSLSLSFFIHLYTFFLWPSNFSLFMWVPNMA